MVNIVLIIGAVAIYATITIWVLSGGLVPRTALGWLGFFAIGIPLWIALELIGHRVNNSKGLNRLSSPIRILILLVCVLVAGAAVLALLSVIQSADRY